MGTAISCTKCSQMAGLIQKLVETPQKHCFFVQLFFVQLFFVQLSFIRRSYIAIVIVDHHVLSVCKRVRAHECVCGKANSVCLKAMCI